MFYTFYDWTLKVDHIYEFFESDRKSDCYCLPLVSEWVSEWVQLRPEFACSSDVCVCVISAWNVAFQIYWRQSLINIYVRQLNVTLVHNHTKRRDVLTLKAKWGPQERISGVQVCKCAYLVTHILPVGAESQVCTSWRRQTAIAIRLINHIIASAAVAA